MHNYDDLEELADFVIRADFVLDLFKKAWHDPEHELSVLEELVLNKIMESEPGRS